MVGDLAAACELVLASGSEAKGSAEGVHRAGGVKWAGVVKWTARAS